METQFLGLKVEHLLVDELEPNPRNARTHSRRQLRMIAASLRKFGFVNPILIDCNNRIIAGRGRLEAAKMEGHATVPTIRLEHLTEEQKRAYVIADNKLAEKSGWDRNILAGELDELIELNWDLEAIGFESGEADILLADIGAEKSEPEDRLPPTAGPAVTLRGDVWMLGYNRIICGDARSERDFGRLMKGELATMMFADPPYNVPVAGHVQGRGRVKHAEFAFASGEMSEPAFSAFLERCLGNAVRVSRDGAVHYVCIDWRHVAELIATGRLTYGAMLNLCVWNKSNAGQGSFYRSQHELIGVFRTGEAPHQNNVELGRHGRNRSNVWTYPGVNSFGAGRDDALASHPTVKPVALVADAMRDCTTKGDLVLDPFLGSGTTLMAAEKIGRRCYGLEYEPTFVDVAIRRWQAYTKADAILEGDGRTFDEIMAERLAAAAQVSPDAAAAESDGFTLRQSSESIAEGDR